MANCPQCKKAWQWDWEQDCYRGGEGETCKIIDFELGEPFNEVSIVFQCTCGVVLGLQFPIGEVVNIKGWEGINWEYWEHNYNSRRDDVGKQKKRTKVRQYR